MQPYNGRTVLAEVAKAHGWIVAEGYAGPGNTDAVFYERGTGKDLRRVLILWTENNCAARIVVNPKTDLERTITGATGLIAVRKYIEGAK